MQGSGQIELQWHKERIIERWRGKRELHAVLVVVEILPG